MNTSAPSLPPPSRRQGAAGLHIAKVRDRSAVISSWSRSPLTLLTPRCSGPSVWAYTSSFGGGMVAGDETSMALQVDPGACCFLSTQASTKIYRNPARRPCAHHLEAELAPKSLLVLAPDPVQCFADSSYQQFQTFQLASDANLVLVDWISSGRSARGERWAFHSYASRNSIRRDGRLILHDSLRLDHDSSLLSNPFRTGRFNCLATVVVLGLALESFAAEILAAALAAPVQRLQDLVFSASPLREGVILRFAGVGLEPVGHAISRALSFVPNLLQGDPWSRKW